MNKKIAFLFLIKEKIYNERLWNIFFSNIHPDKYKIHIHYKINTELLYFNKYKLEKCIETSWGDRSLVDAQNLLIKESLKDKNVTNLIILSDNCIPIKNFDYIYNFLDPNYSYFERKGADLKQLNDSVYYYLKKQEIKKSSQWCILNRKHAEFLYNKEMIIKYYEKNNYPDERVYITALDKFGMKDEIIDMCTTYCKWGYKCSHPKNFELIKTSFLYYLLESHHLFARKFTNCYVKEGRKVKHYIQEFMPYLIFLKSKKNKEINHLETINLIKDIGFDGNSKEYNDIINNNKGNILHCIQDILEDEHQKYKDIYSSKDY